MPPLRVFETTLARRLGRYRCPGVACLICRGTGSVIVRRMTPSVAGTFQHVLRCQDCGLEFVWPLIRESAESPATVTDENYRRSLLYEHASAERLVRIRAEARLRFCTELLGHRPASILDAGAAGGWFVAAYSELGVRAMGIEIDPELANAAERLHADVRVADICSWSPPHRFDVVWCSQTLEHITTPVAAVQNMRSFLARNGAIEVDVPNSGSWGARVRRLVPMNGTYGAIKLPQHQIAYRAETLDRLLREAGLRSVVLAERPADDPLFGLVILPAGTVSRLAISASRLLGHGNLLVAVAR